MKLSEIEGKALAARVFKLEMQCEALAKSNSEMTEQVTLLTAAYLRMNTILKVVVAKCPTAQQLLKEDDLAKAEKAGASDMLPSAPRTDPSPADGHGRGRGQGAGQVL